MTFNLSVKGLGVAVLLVGFAAPLVTAQKVIDVKGLKICNYYGETAGEDLVTFPADSQAMEFITSITKHTGIPQNFTVFAANVRNASAIVDKDNKRLILYSQDFVRGITKSTGDRWAATSVMAHEIGHHLSNHALTGVSGASKMEQELEADKYSGHVLRHMAATLEQAKSAMERQPDQSASGYPPKSARLAAIENGWIEGDEEIKKASGTGETHQVAQQPDVRRSDPVIQTPPMPSSCSVTIRSNPSDADVTLDGVAIGTTPVDVEVERSKPHRLRIEKEKYEAYTSSIDCTTRSLNPRLKTTVGKIQIRYTGDMAFCSLNIRINIGGKTFTPTSNLFTARDVQLGDQDYQIQGQIGCPRLGACNATGSGSIDVRDGAIYDVMWTNNAYATCTVSLR